MKTCTYIHRYIGTYKQVYTYIHAKTIKNIYCTVSIANVLVVKATITSGTIRNEFYRAQKKSR